MGSLEEWMAQWEGEAEVERDLAFTIEPWRVRKGLLSFVKPDRNLWFWHLLQLLHEAPQLEAPRLRQVSSDAQRVRLELSLPKGEFLGSLVPIAVAQQEAHVFNSTPAAWMARILCETDTTAIYRHSETEQVLVSNRERFVLYPDHQAVPQDVWPQREASERPEQGLCLELDWPALKSEQNRARAGRPSNWLQRAGLTSHPPVIESVHPLEPDWPQLVDPAMRSEIPWEWESVLPAPTETNGFRWLVGCAGVPQCRSDHFGVTMIHNPRLTLRSWSRLPILASYPKDLAASLLDSDPTGQCPGRLIHGHCPTGTTVVRARAVLGIVTSAMSPAPQGLLYPVIRGVPVSTPIPLPHGCFVLADATGLRTDLSGLELVRDLAFLDWYRELQRWCRDQLRLYLVCHRRAHQLAIERHQSHYPAPKSWWGRWIYGTVPLNTPDRSQIRQRRSEFTSYFQRGESSPL